MKFNLLRKQKFYSGRIEIVNDYKYLIIDKDLTNKIKKYPTYDLELDNTNSIILKVGYSFPFKINKRSKVYALFMPTKITCYIGHFNTIIIKLMKEGK